MFNNIAFLFTFLVTIIASCSIEEANQNQKNELIIASDFLKSKDTTLFKNFSKTNNIRIKNALIKHLCHKLSKKMKLNLELQQNKMNESKQL